MSISGTNLAAEWQYNNAAIDGLMKTKFGELYDEVFNTSQPLWNAIPKTNDFVGKRLEFPVPQGYLGGIGSGRLPEWRTAPYGDVSITSKRIYALHRIDRESVMASQSSEGAFVKLMAEAVKKTAQADAWNHNRMLFNDGSGSLGTITGTPTAVGSGVFDCVISSTTFKAANWEEGMLVNVSTNTDLFLITTVTESSRTIRLQRQAGGTYTPAASDVIYMQGSYNSDIAGLKVLDSTTGSVYGVPVGRRWQATQIGSAGAISEALLNRLMISVEKACGKTPTIGVTSYKQYELLLNLFATLKRYNPDKGENQGKFGMAGIDFIGSQGVMKIFPDKFCEDDRFYALNDKYIKYFRRPNTGFVKEDVGGQGYLRVIDEDQFELRHATYGELFIALPFHGVMTGLSVA